ncbi:MAG: polyamine aminopropyltransferase [Kiloniellales bacterium]|nr:polyamine aminopropyltransferase [Kiloniellales bacterium]
MTAWSEEADRDGGAWRLQLRIERVLHRETTPHQDLLLFENPLFGRVLALDGIVQTTENDEFFYHEMLVHVPVLAHGAVERALIVGGGDGGALEELLKHGSLREATLVEIDRSVIDFSRTHLEAICGKAFEDRRLELVIADGLAWVAEQRGRRAPFDLILIDSTDPVGPGEVLFTESFYADCAGLLAEDGLLVTQNAVPFTEPASLAGPLTALGRSFAATACYRVAVPSFFGGDMVFVLAARAAAALKAETATLEQRFAASGIETRYYTPAVHQGAFALPRCIAELIEARPGAKPRVPGGG